MDRADAGDEPVFNSAIGTATPALARHLVALRERPELPGEHYAAGVEYGRLHRLDAARHHLREAVRLDPHHAPAHGALAEVLVLSGQVDRAVHHARLAHELVPNDPGLAVGLAAALDANRQAHAAWEIVDRLLRAGHQTTRLALLYATMATAGGGREGPALEMVLGLLKAIPPRPAPERSSLHFAAARLLDHTGRYDEAFAHASRANALRGVTYDPRLIERLTGQFIEYFTRATLRRLPCATVSSPAPVFVVGMPRSGTSLVQQILASHPAVAAAGERDWVFRLWESAVQRHADPTTPLWDSLERLSVNDLNELASQYLGYLRWVGPGAARVIDKTPANLMHLGLIALLFPAARVIFCDRDPLDTCLSCFMTDFATGNHFSFSQESLGHSYRQTARLASHWKAQLDLPMLEVRYEDVIVDLEGQARRMVDFLGLPWDERCLRFHENPRYVPTSSSAQVRQPIYQKSVGRWRNYERHLAPLRVALDGR